MARRSKEPEVHLPLGLVLVRIVAGWLFLSRGWVWVKTGSFDGSLVRARVEDALPGLSAWLAFWGERVVLSNPDAFAFFWRWGALLIGLSFVLGAFTRPAGCAAVLVLAHGLAFGPDGQEPAFLLGALIAFACAASGAGRRLGFDAMFDQHFPGWVTWARRPSSGFLQ